MKTSNNIRTDARFKNFHICQSLCSYTTGYVSNRHIGDISVDEILFHQICRPKHQKKTFEIREQRRLEIEKGYPDTRSKYLKSQMYLWYPSGTFNKTDGKLALKQFSGIIAIDIDEKDNYGITTNEMKRRIFGDPFVAYCALSCRGAGVYCLIKVPHDASDNKIFGLYYDKIKEYFLSSFGLKTDDNCRSLYQSRVFSYDDNPIINENAYIWTTRNATKQDNTTQRINTSYTPPYSGVESYSKNYLRVSRVVKEITEKNIDIAPTIREWFAVGCSLASYFGEEGRDFFYHISRTWENNTGKRQTISPQREYDECLRRSGNLGTFFKYVAKCGVIEKDL